VASSIKADPRRWLGERSFRIASISRNIEELLFDLISKYEPEPAVKAWIRWRNISLIVHREVRDQLRDRRTLFMTPSWPLLLYPALGIGMMQLTVLFREQPRTSSFSVPSISRPDFPLLEGNRFAERWFSKKASAAGSW